MSDSRYVEDYCLHCEVTLPPRTPRCPHCGGPTHRDHPSRAATREAGGLPRTSTGPPSGRGSHGASPTIPPGGLPAPDGGGEEVAAETEEAPSLWRRAGVALLWALMAIGITVYRACTES